MRVGVLTAIAGLAVLWPTTSSAQTGTVQVRVHVGETSVLLPGVPLRFELADGGFGPTEPAELHLNFITFLANIAHLSTNQNGTAVIEKVPPGKYIISAQREGYYGYASNGTVTPAAVSETIRIGTGQWTSEVSLTLHAEPFLSGQVRDGNGIAVPNACVDLGRFTLQNGQGVFAPVTTVFTDTDGEYRLRTSGPGYYFVRVRSAIAQPAFYPGNSDLEKAAFVAVVPGAESSGIDIFLPKGAAATPLPDVAQLIRESDFIGFVTGSPWISDPTGEWRRLVFPMQVDSIKGVFERNTDGQYPWVSADRVSVSGYPTAFSRSGTSLVFLRRETGNGKETWTTTAAFPVNYRLNEDGQIVGTLWSGSNGEEMSALQIRTVLEQALQGSAPSAELQLLDRRFRQAAASQCAPDGSLKSVSPEGRLREVQRLAPGIKVGTTRADVEKMFPELNGGLCDVGIGCYYVEPEVRVDVPYDDTGGFWSPANKVVGPVKVYQGSPLLD